MNTTKINYTVNAAGILRSESGTLLAVWRQDEGLLYMADSLANGAVHLAVDEAGVEAVMEEYIKAIK